MNDYLAFAKKLAIQAGDIMLQYFDTDIAVEAKEDASPLTIADTTINKMVIDAIHEAYPDHGIIGEEESDHTAGTEYVWVCDPIDGTIPFTMGVPTSQFSLALVKDGVSILGVLYDPYTKRMYEAVKGEGATLNGQPLHVNDTATHDIPKGLISTAVMDYGLIRNDDLLYAALNAGERAYSVCCATYEAALVARGKTAATIFPGNSPWDIAAVKVIIEEAGGKVTDLTGKEQRYDQPIRGAIVSNGVVHDRLVALVSSHLR